MILGGGPSLTKETCDAILLSGLTTIGVNGVLRMMVTKYHLHVDHRPSKPHKQYSWTHRDELKEIYRLGTKLFAPLNDKHEPTMTEPPHTPFYPDHEVEFTSRWDGTGILKLGSSSTSIFHAIQLAVIMGSKRIVLIGVDFYVDVDEKGEGKMHSYDYENKAMRRDVDGLEKRRLKFEWSLENKAKPVLDEMGVKVLNASPRSKLTAFPKVELSEAL